jgi:hypothetical protein
MRVGNLIRILLFAITSRIHYFMLLPMALRKDEAAFLERIKSLWRKAAIDTLAVIDNLRAHGFTPLSAHLNIESRSAVEILIVVPRKDFYSNAFDSVYDFSLRQEQKSKTSV